jgi:hypothetical protein
MEQWTSKPPQRQQTWVLIPPGYKVFSKNKAMLLCVFDLKCNVFTKFIFKAIAKLEK